MPRFDGTGPQGMGPVTGRGMGPCAKGGFGIRRCPRQGRGYGRGLGRYFGFNDPQTKEERIGDIKAYKKALQEELEDAENELLDVQKQK